MGKLPLNVYRGERIALILKLERGLPLQLMLESGTINYIEVKTLLCLETYLLHIMILTHLL
jgi:hypothetical protein